MPSRKYGYQYDTSPRKLKPNYNNPNKNNSRNIKQQNNSYGYNNQKNKDKNRNQDANLKKNKTNSQYKNTNLKSNNKNNREIKNKANSINSNKNAKAQNKLKAKAKISIFIKCVMFFVIMFCIIFRNSQISQLFSQIQNLKVSITELEKENDQLEINIQNGLNLNTIEQAAKELLGMQKISNKQVVHISLPKKDYVEPRTEEIIIEENNSLFHNLLEKVKDFLNI